MHLTRQRGADTIWYIHLCPIGMTQREGERSVISLTNHLSDYIIQPEAFARGFLITDVSGFKVTPAYLATVYN